jgi:ABC-type polysaccharide/polyol phosphate transport system ATPase subunit
MSSEFVLSVRNLGKAYHLYARPEDRLKQALLHRFGREYGKAFWALHDVSFDLPRGQMLAIIGKNGSGKSTLLQMIAGTLNPTKGTIDINGRVTALLELGSGFHPDFTGRENIYINGAIFGLSRREIDEKIDKIIDFADIGDFIDQPVKYYSSGMFVRLAFSVTTGLDPDLLIVDEALAVGDVFFKQKCYRRLEELLAGGTSVVLVTHNMADVEMFADQALLLHKGYVHYQGDPSNAIRQYFLLEQQEQEKRIAQSLSVARELNTELQNNMSQGESDDSFSKIKLQPVKESDQITNGKAVCLGVLITDDSGEPRQVFFQGDIIYVHYEFEILENILVPIGGLAIHNVRDVFVHGRTNLESASPVPTNVQKGRRLRFQQWVKLDLEPGEYTVEVGLTEILPDLFEQRHFMRPDQLREGLVRLCHVPRATSFIIALRSQGSPSLITHRGLCNLPGDISLEIL